MKCVNMCSLLLQLFLFACLSVCLFAVVALAICLINMGIVVDFVLGLSYSKSPLLRLLMVVVVAGVEPCLEMQEELSE